MKGQRNEYVTGLSTPAVNVQTTGGKKWIVCKRGTSNWTGEGDALTGEDEEKVKLIKLS